VFGSAEIANGAPGPTNVDALHREILDGMLRESTWETIGAQLSKSARDEMVLMWHKLDGACTIHALSMRTHDRSLARLGAWFSHVEGEDDHRYPFERHDTPAR
jgi:hypothetical protein